MVAGQIAPASIAARSPQGRWVLFTVVLGSAMAFIDSTVVTLAIPFIAGDLAASAAELQWVITSYALVLAALVLPSGSLGDRFGRRRIFLIGIGWFAGASLICALAPTSGWLIGARALQGVGGALLTPGALAVIQSSFVEQDRMRAIGTWSGVSGVAAAIGPFVGGWLIGLPTWSATIGGATFEAASWRWVFLVNIPLAALVIWAALRHVPESKNSTVTGRLDVGGTLLSAIGLGGISYAFIAWPEGGFGSMQVWGSLLLGIVALSAFVFVQRFQANPTLPLRLFQSRSFTATNFVTMIVYTGLGGFLFFTTIALQVVVGWSPVAAGAVALPITVLLLVMSPRVGALATTYGPRIFMAAGPLVGALGMLLLARVGPGASYLIDVLPGVLLLGAGLGLVVAPLTATALAGVNDDDAGVASGFNNAIARTGGLLAVAVLPLLAGVGNSFTDPATFEPAFRTSMLICAALLAAGGAIAAVTIPSSYRAVRADAARTLPPGKWIDTTSSPV